MKIKNEHQSRLGTAFRTQHRHFYIEAFSGPFDCVSYQLCAPIVPQSWHLIHYGEIFYLCSETMSFLRIDVIFLPLSP